MDEDTATEDTATDDIPLGDLLPGLADLPGTPQEALLGGPLRRHLARRDELRWSSLAAISPAEIAAVSGIGPVRTKQILSRLSSFVALKTSRIDRPEPSTPSDLASGLVEAVAEIAAWAVGTGRDGSLLDAISAASDTDSADVPLAQLDWLAQLPTSAICTPEHARTYDPVAVASDLIASFDERERAILDRVLDFDRSAPTLQEIGERFSVSRERIRQIEKRIRTNLDQAIGSPTTRPLVAAADRLRDRL
ncbi:MAG TPA: sigma factor-like helix-turn-helix DNA-binding protein, partial [Microthrixaceae bacterium]|nr:sigma factor-like helix-turn-helix DNA-binding protein [Microthrixaceae bacterium]